MASLVDSWNNYSSVDLISVSPDGASVGAGGKSGTVTIWDIRTGKVRLGPLHVHEGEVWSVEFSPDGSMFATGSTDMTIRVWDGKTGNAVAKPFKGHTKAVTSATFSRDNRHILSGSHDGTIRIWDARTGNPLGTFIKGRSEVHLVVISPNGGIVVSACADGTFQAYNMINRALLFEGRDSETAVAFSPNGDFIAYGSLNFTVCILDGTTGRTIGKPLRGHTDRVVWVAFSPNGKYIVSASADATIRIWDAVTGEPHGEPLLGHTSLVRAAAFALDGRCIVSGSWDWQVKKWNIHGVDIQARPLDTMVETKQVELEISHTTTQEDIILVLGARGCPDMTDQLDSTTCSSYPISTGGFGDIYRCRLKNSMDVAVKVVRLQVGPGEQDQKVLKFTARELYTWSRCKHPNVQPLLGLAMFRGHIGMIARWESNGNLSQYLAQCEGLDRCTTSTQVAEGLSYLHASGVVHGDLKAANILVSPDGVPQLADFGNATLNEYTLKFTGKSFGEALSSRWAAPEIFEGASSNYATDIYALGMTILEIITGEIPWGDKNDQAVMYAVTITKTRPQRPEAQVPTDSKHGDILWALLNSCWKSKPEQRLGAKDVLSIMKAITQRGLERA